jgi:GNAT superfamily N-acetyltransferase
VIEVAELQASEVELVDRLLPLSRLDQQVEQGSTYLVAWEDGRPVGHAHVAWTGTHIGVPEVQDVFVLPAERRRGIASRLTAAAEAAARARGFGAISLSVSAAGNDAARALYAKLGYVDAGVEPVRVSGTIMLRGRPFAVDDTLLYLTKPLGASVELVVALAPVRAGALRELPLGLRLLGLVVSRPFQRCVGHPVASFGSQNYSRWDPKVNHSGQK